VLGTLTFACSPSQPAPATARPQELWGEISPVVSVKELMRDMIDPIADNIFESVKIVVDKKGTVFTEPRTDADWEKIRIGAVVMAEGASLLKIPRPFAPPGDENDSAGPEPIELSPAQIKAKIEKDPVAWNARIQTLRNVGLEVLEIVKERKTQELWDAGENLDTACENCHMDYWYPGNKAFLEKIDKRLEELYGKRANRSPLGMMPPR
jgi:hypothetical protein